MATGCASTAPSARQQMQPCTGWVELGGTFNSGSSNVTFAISNTSGSSGCLATRLTVLFSSQVERLALGVSSPEGWAPSDAPCPHERGVCGIRWESKSGVVAGGSQSGFAMRLSAATAALLQSWTVDIGGTRRSMPIGHVGG